MSAFPSGRDGVPTQMNTRSDSSMASRHIGREAEATGLPPGAQEVVEVPFVERRPPVNEHSSLAASFSTPMT